MEKKKKTMQITKKRKIEQKASMKLRKTITISKIDKIKGYYIFSFSQLTSENAKEEVSNMLKVMQSNNQD